MAKEVALEMCLYGKQVARLLVEPVVIMEVQQHPVGAPECGE